MYTIDQLEILMLVAERDPREQMEMALQLRQRWHYIGQVANGRQLDMSLAAVNKGAAVYARKATLIVAALDEWIEEQNQKKAAS